MWNEQAADNQQMKFKSKIANKQSRTPTLGLRPSLVSHFALRTLNSGFRAQPAAFTLVEIIIALSIAMLIIGVATLSITGLNDEHRLRKAASAIEQTARDALMDAVASYQPVTLALDGGLGSLDGESATSILVKRFGEREFRQARKGESWEFSPTGICEPIELRITSSSGTIELGFDPLTGCARKRNIIVNG